MFMVNEDHDQHVHQAMLLMSLHPLTEYRALDKREGGVFQL